MTRAKKRELGQLFMKVAEWQVKSHMQTANQLALLKSGIQMAKWQVKADIDWVLLTALLLPTTTIKW